MKVIWFRLLTLTLAFASSGVSAMAQYPSNGNVGPSSFPIAQTNQVGLQNLPQVPSSYAPQQQMSTMQLTGMQETVPAPAIAPMAPVPQTHTHQPMAAPQPATMAPAAMAPQAGCQTCAPNALGYQAPMQYASPGYQSTLTPGCATCGPAPVSQIGVPAYSGFTAAAPAYGVGGFGGRLAGLPSGAKPYFAGGGFLLFNRVDDKSRPLALYDASGLDALTTGDAQMSAMPGFEVMFGRYFNCGRNAIAASYWGIFSDTEMAQITSGTAGELRSRILASGDVHMPIDPTGATTPYDVYDWYDNAWTHRVRRSSDYQNVEVNLLGFSVGGASRNFNRATGGTLFSGTRHGAGHAGCGYCGGAGCGACGSSCGTAACAPSPRFATGPTGYIGPNCGSRLNLSWLAGVRYFRFEDYLQYAASFNNDGINRTVDDIYYENTVTNEMIGFQIGGRGDYCLGKRFNLYTSGKVGVYGNQASLNSNLYNDFGTAYEFGVPTNSYAIDVNETRVAFLSEIGTGIGVRISPKWTATFGYRAVIASGVATAVGNLRHPRDLPRDQSCIDLDSTLILHGFNVGALYNF